MPQFLEGEHDAAEVKLAFVVARFNHFITDKLLDGALRAIGDNGGDAEAVTIARVPGSLELAVAARRLAASHDAVICLGCVIRGHTGHYEVVVEGTRQGVVAAAQDTGVPVIFGVLTCPTLELAMERSSGEKNAGYSAAVAGIQMAHLMKKL